MMSRRLVGSQSLRAAALRTPRAVPLIQQRFASQADIEDPGMNGGYINPPREKRQFRDPHANWDDPQERRNFGEPVHEDNDILGVFSPYEYTWTTPGKGLVQIGAFVATVLGLCGVVSLFYPDIPAVPKEYPGGLEQELGGPEATRARKEGDALPF